MIGLTRTYCNPPIDDFYNIDKENTISRYIMSDIIKILITCFGTIFGAIFGAYRSS